MVKLTTMQKVGIGIHHFLLQTVEIPLSGMTGGCFCILILYGFYMPCLAKSHALRHISSTV